MKRISTPWVSLLVTLITVLASISQAQQSGSGPGIAETPSSQAVSSRVLSFSDSVPGQPDGALTVTFAIYPDQQSTTPAWTETQVVQVTQSKYSALLGSTTAAGIPPDAFAADQAHWLGVQVIGIEKRYLLVSVPYAMKAVEAERLGGLLPSQFVTVSQLQTALNNAATGSSSSSGSKPATGVAAQASTNPPQPATDFTDNNASEVLLVTQQGTGFAIHAISAGDAALFAENNTTTGTALKALASATSGANVGLLAQSASPTGIAGVFDNTGGGQILSLRANGNEVASVDNSGSFRANQINGGSFFGNGFGLFGIPPSAVNAQSANIPNTIVMRDSSGSFTGNQINASVFFGNGFGLFGIPPSAVNAQSGNVANSIVMRDSSGSFTANQINASVFFGNGFGLFGITPSGVNAQSANVANTIVMRDSFGNFAANQINGSFIGLGNGLFGIPPSAVGAQSQNVANSIVMRDASGNFSAGGIQAFGTADFTVASSTAPVKAVTAANAPTTCFASRDLLIKTDATPGQQLFICNATGNGYVLVGDGTAAGVTSVGAGDGSVAISGTAAAPTVAVANGGITSAKLAANAVTTANIATGSITNTQLAANSVTAANIADGSLPPTKIVGTVATLGANTFTGNQIVQGSLAAASLGTGPLSATSALFSAGGTSDNQVSIKQSSSAVIAVTANDLNVRTAINASSIQGDAIDAKTTYNTAVSATSTNGIGVLASGGDTGVETAGTNFGVKANGATALVGNGTNIGLAANVSAASGVAVSMTTNGGGKFLSGTSVSPLGSTETFNVDSLGNILSAGAVSAPFFNDPAGTSPSLLARLNSDGGVQRADITNTTGLIGVVISNPGPTGFVEVAYSGVVNCAFDGPTVVGHYVVASTTSGGFCSDGGSSYPSAMQVLGRILRSSSSPTTLPILLFGPEMRGSGGGTVSSINTGAGLTGGPINSSGTISIANAGITNSMLQNNSLTVNAGPGLSGGGIVPLGGLVTLNNTGALSFNGRTGSIISQPGDYSFGQLAGTASSGQLPATVVYNNQSNTFTADQTINGALNGTTANLQSLAVNTTSSQFLLAPLQINDNGGAPSALYAYSQNHKAAAFQSTGPVILTANNFVEDVFTIFKTGEVSVLGGVTARAFTGDGSALFNVNASSVGGISSANLATTSALGSETSTRQSADAALATSVSAETAARQSDVSNMQTNINNVSAADAKLAASNTFTAGTQDFSGAGATLPVRALLSSQTPTSCVAGKELLIKTDAPAGQQLFICDGGGTTWNLVGDGASGGVTSFNGRNGSVSPSSGDYSFSQISGSVAASQLPALTGDVTAAAGTGVTLLSSTGVAPGAYSKVSVDEKGRVVSGSQAAFSDLAGNASQAQLPVNVVYNNQVNTFSAGQTVNGNLSATFFMGNGGGLSNVNAATLNNLASSSFAQLATNNTFTGSVSASSFSGNGSGLTNVNASTVNNFQMLKFNASITPASVSARTCSEQSFAVSGVNNGDVVLGAQITTHSPGTNIAIGGARVSGANTVAIQFCNVSGSNSTPAAGTYTFALMR